MEIYYQYLRFRKDFGREPKGIDFEEAEMIFEMRPNEAHQAAMLDRNPCTTTVSVIPEFSEHMINTAQTTYKRSNMVHTEGGWPRDVDSTAPEQVSRFRKRIERDEDYIAVMQRLVETTEPFLKQNNAVDIYELYFDGESIDHAVETPNAKTLTVFRDPAKEKRSATYIAMHPTSNKKVAVAYSIMQFQKQPEGMDIRSFLWDLNNSSKPELELRPDSQLCCMQFNPKDDHIIGAGQYNGQFVFFDDRKGNTPVEASPIEFSHKDPVYDCAWLASKTVTEMLTCSTDGQVFVWDTRRISEPVESLMITEKGQNTVLGAVCLEYEAAAGASKFIVGTEQGMVVTCNMKGKSQADKIGGSFQAHFGPVYSIERNPFYPKYCLSVGDWSAKIWNEDIKTPIMTTKYHQTYLTGGQWSATRPAVFMTTKMDGSLDVWDYFYKQREPTLSVQVTDKPLTALGNQGSGKIVAVGSADGSTTILELCEGLVTMQPNEKQVISQIFERESRREKNLEQKQKEAKAKARKEAAAAAANQSMGGNFSVSDAANLENEFMDSTKEVEEEEPAEEEAAE